MKNNIQRKIIYALLGALALFGTGLSCGGGQTAPTVTLNFWKPFDSSDKWSEIISAYNSAGRGAQIVYTQKSSESYERDLLEAQAAGRGPDIYSIHNDWTPRYRDKISPMPADYLTLRELQEIFVDVVADDFLMEDGKLYALPGAVDVLGLYFNRDHLASAGIARPPSTWPELVNMVPLLTKVGSSAQIEQSAIALGTSNNVNNASDILQLLMLQSGVSFYDSSLRSSTISRGNTDQSGETPGERTLKFFAQFADPTSRAYTWNAKLTNSIDAFAQSKTSMILGFSHLMPEISAKDAFLNFAATGAPQVSSDTTKVNYASYWGEAVWSGSRYPNTAWDFILFATNYQQNKKYTETVRLPSSRRDVLAEQQRDSRLGVFADNVLSARSVAKPEAGQFEKVLHELINDVSLNGIAPRSALQEAERQINTLLNRYPLQPN